MPQHTKQTRGVPHLHIPAPRGIDPQIVTYVDSLRRQAEFWLMRVMESVDQQRGARSTPDVLSDVDYRGNRVTNMGIPLAGSDAIRADLVLRRPGLDAQYYDAGNLPIRSSARSEHPRDVVIREEVREVQDQAQAANSQVLVLQGQIAALQAEVDAIGAVASDPTLTALAGLATSADTLPYFTGVDTAALTPMTAFARTLLDDVDAAQMRATLVLGTLATLSTVATANITDDAVTYAKLQNISTNNRLLGRATAGAGNAEEITIGAGLLLTATTLSSPDPVITGTAMAATRYNAANNALEPAPLVFTAAGEMTATSINVGVTTNALTLATQGAGALTPLTLDGYNNAVGPISMMVRKANGTIAAPTRLLTTTHQLLQITSAGYVRNAGDTADAYVNLVQVRTGIESLDAQGRAGGYVSVLTSPGVSAAPAEVLRISQAGNLDVYGNTLRLRTARTPASATAAGNAGDICWDAGFLYLCSATNTWRRVAHATW